ncbi:hypothetical protein H2201_003454 [Coniosporium apollinis]|uniref:VOC domain-containing protein n=1 Tax=Coniosporium apollinis TaxID=61459 RepID=A0ABQ9NZN9_9PEZI|nr:hypothetical protein H2201_003454 [Coniosporium apollinis]
MPVSHIGLTVSHLPTSCSFFLSALQPLGYRFIGQQGNQIGLGIDDADFFLCQETPHIKAGAAHIAFSAPGRIAVRDFYTAALNAGGRPHGAPGVRDQENGHFNAAVLDFDGNSIEVVYREDSTPEEAGSVVGHSRVLTWRKSVTESLGDARSVVSSSTVRTARKDSVIAGPAAPRSIAPSAIARSEANTLTRSVSAPVVQQSSISVGGDDACKKIIGTLLGAAAGAAVAYAMCKGEEDSARAEAVAYAASQASSRKLVEAPLQEAQPQPTYESPDPKRLHRNFSDTESFYSTPDRYQRAIAAAPARSYHSPTYISVPPTQAPQQTIEYIPAASVVSARSHRSAKRSVSSPIPTAAHSTVSKTRSTLISTFVPDEAPRALPAPSEHSVHSSGSKARSSHTAASKYSSRRSSASQVPLPESKPPSIIGSIIGRGDEEYAVLPDDNDSVAPSDSISNAGSRRSSHSKSSKHSKHSKSSRHSEGRSHRSSSGKSTTSRREELEVVRPDVVEEAESQVTVKPYKSEKSKDKVSVASLPVRGITPSMIEGRGGKRSVVSFAMGQ